MNSNVELSAREDYFISGRKSCFKRSNFRAECCLLYKLTISVTRTYQMWKAVFLYQDLLKYQPKAMISEKGNFRRKQRDQLGRFWGHVLNTKQSNLKFGKFVLQK